MGKIKKYLDDPSRLYLWATAKGLTRWVPDALHLRLVYRIRVGARLNFDNPRTFNEKLQWLKLHDRNPLYNTLVDKYAVKEWVAERVGSEYVTRTYAVWDRAEDIDVSNLPERFVLKTNHDCGGVVVCRSRASFDLEAAKNTLARHLKTNYFWNGREWPYKDVSPRIFAEEYLDPGERGDLADYKLMCFGGKVLCSFTCTSRAKGDLRVDFFDTEWRHLPFMRHYPNADTPPSKPESYGKMVEMAEILSAGIPFVRVDFYEVGRRPYFGEMTFFPGDGFEEFNPSEWDGRLGQLIDLTRAYGYSGEYLG